MSDVRDIRSAPSLQTERPVKRAELEKALGCSARSIQNFVSEGMPVYRRYRGYNLYMVSECDAWMQQQYDGAHAHSTGGKN